MTPASQPGRPAQARRAALRGAHAAARVIEGFQAAFLEVATATLPVSEYAVKGGVNMRFFFGSVRSSKDMDFDYLGERFHTWDDRVNALFDRGALDRLLRLRGIRIAALNRLKKQTDVTRRWTLLLASDTVRDASSKVEFSAREAGKGRSAERETASIDADLARGLGIGRVALQHYVPSTAIAQKVAALRQRAHTEPRDVFDLDHLIRRFGGALSGASLQPAEIEAAVERAQALTYDEYESAVVPYLEEELWPVLGSVAAWEAMRARVIDALEARRLEPLR